MWWLACLVGVLTGIVSGMGIGGGTLLVLYLTAVLQTDPSAAAGINLLYFLGCAPPSLWIHWKNDRIHRPVAVWAAIGGAVTAVIAALLVPSSSPDWLRRAFGALLLVVGVRELWQALHTENTKG